MNKHVLVVAAILGAVVPAWAAPSLCTPAERTVLACHTKAKSFELCASNDLTATSGYLQYRAGANGTPSFVFPAQLHSSLTRFRVELLAKGARLVFSDGEYGYAIYEPLAGTSSIVVSHGGRESATIDCLNNTDSLTSTPNLDWFRLLGIYE